MTAVPNAWLTNLSRNKHLAQELLRTVSHGMRGVNPNRLALNSSSQIGSLLSKAGKTIPNVDLLVDKCLRKVQRLDVYA